MRDDLPGRRDPEHGARDPRSAARRDQEGGGHRTTQGADAGAGLPADQGGARGLSPAPGQGSEAALRDRGRGGGHRGGGRQRHAAARLRSDGGGAEALPGRQDPPVLRRHGEDHGGHRRALFGRHRPVEMHRLPGVRGCVRAGRAGGAGADRRGQCRTRLDLRVPQHPAEHSDALLRQRHAARRRHQAPDPRPQQLLRDDRRPRRLPRLRRNHGGTPDHRGQPRNPPGPAPASHRRAGGLDRAPAQQVRRGAARPAGPEASRAHEHGAAGAGKTALPLRERADRRRSGERDDRQCHRLQQRVCLDLPVQPLHRPVGQQPVPGHPGGGQGPVRGPVRERGGRLPRAAHRQARSRGPLRPGDPRQVLQVLPLEPVLRGGAGADAGGHQHGRRRRHLRHRLRRAVAAADHRHAGQGRGPEHRLLFEHRRPGLHGQLHGAGFGSQPLRHRPHRQAGGPQGDGADRGLPSERAGGADHGGAAGAFHEVPHGVPQLQRVGRAARRLYALHVRAGHRGRRRQPARAAGGDQPHEPCVRARSAPRRHAGRALRAGRQPGHRQGLDDDDLEPRRRRRQDPAHGRPAHAGRLRPAGGALPEALPPAERRG